MAQEYFSLNYYEIMVCIFLDIVPRNKKIIKFTQNDLDSLFVNKTMLCCCKKRSNTISPNDIEK